MKKNILLFLLLVCTVLSGYAQLLSWTPAFAKDNDNIVITMDATKGNQGLLNFSGSVYVHVGVITSLSTSSSDWRYVKFTWGTSDVNAQAAAAGTNKWSYTISNIRTFFNVPAGESIRKIAILFRNGAGSQVQRNTDASDMYVPVYDNTLATRFTVPPFQPTYIPAPEPITKQVGDNISLTAIASANADMKLYLNGSVIQTATGVTTISASPALATSGNQVIVAEATAAAVTKTDTLRFFVSNPATVAPLPAGVKDGINYLPGNTSATLVLYAPGKSRVCVIGEFTGSNWQEQSAFQMSKTPDGNYWWITLTALTPGTEYAFQYLVDGTLKVAEPYSEKILDPSNDGFIPAASYPNLRPYPNGSTTGIVSILQTAEPAYTWSTNSYTRPDKRNLVVYELLVRDYLANRNWNTLRDTLTYLKNLGVNAVEIMPLNEFEGNESWGYNPNFFLAPDKYYGTKNALKQFIDSCHSKGIAVIMDIALNHATGTCPLAALYWNSATNQPAANNPWFNETAKHPFNVFNDFNHESLATRNFSSRVIAHWLQEYKVDGYRFDLSKGFTQVNSGSDVNAWSAYDASRIAIWKRYYDTMQLKAPGSIAVLEHFAANTEEIELSNYGFLLWGNNTFNYQEASMGYLANSNFEGSLHTARGWSNPHLVAYAESHDEERIMYKNLQFGNSSGTYNVRELNTALKRSEMTGAFLLTMPGPKMFWEFGELGYDYSINTCVNGSVDNACRLDPKPVRWDYLANTQRRRVRDIYSSVLKLRQHAWYKDLFIANNITIDRSLGGGFKWMKFRSATDSSDICVIGNFDVLPQTGSFTFPVPGTWYDYLGGSTYTASGSAQSITLQPGEYYVYLNRNLVNAVTTPVSGVRPTGQAMLLNIFPNPVSANSTIELFLPETGKVQVQLVNYLGQAVTTLYSGMLQKGNHFIPLTSAMAPLASGGYLVRVQKGTEVVTAKLIVK